mmetsp:Transcript_12971/g.27541  ORF Transcript_12971/g.27541 Transcript_12971/m.27541 type:complete len:265 (-) Transcript_12971:294-1088(-)
MREQVVHPTDNIEHTNARVLVTGALNRARWRKRGDADDVAAIIPPYIWLIIDDDGPRCVLFSIDERFSEVVVLHIAGVVDHATGRMEALVSSVLLMPRVASQLWRDFPRDDDGIVERPVHFPLQLRDKLPLPRREEMSFLGPFIDPHALFAVPAGAEVPLRTKMLPSWVERVQDGGRAVDNGESVHFQIEVRRQLPHHLHQQGALIQKFRAPSDPSRLCPLILHEKDVLGDQRNVVLYVLMDDAVIRHQRLVEIKHADGFDPCA